MWCDREQSALAPKRSARYVSDLVNSKLYGRAYQIYIKLDFHKNPIWRILSNPVTYEDLDVDMDLEQDTTIDDKGQSELEKIFAEVGECGDELSIYRKKMLKTGFFKIN